MVYVTVPGVRRISKRFVKILQRFFVDGVWVLRLGSRLGV